MIFVAIHPFLIPGLFLILMAGILTARLMWKSHQNKLRREAFSALAETLDCSYSENDTFGLAQQLKGFDLFKKERTRWFRKGKVSHVLRSKVGDTDVFMFDYTYVVQAGNTPKEITQTVFFANDKNWFLPRFKLRPEKWWHKLQSGLNLDKDINFEENKDFSDKFWLKSDFEALVRKQFTPELQGFLAEKPPANLEADNYYLIAYKPRKKLNSAEAYVFFQHCCEVVGMLQKEGKVELLQLAELDPTPIEMAAAAKQNR